ncbi:MAG: hypothetical protein PVI97_12635 [Candidatus Thiodiazotropha sp.]|jgi:hypothetical protein
MGQQSISTYELDAGALRRSRQKAQIAAYNIFSIAKTATINRGETPEEAEQAGLDALTASIGTNPEYSPAIEDFIALY